MLVPTPTALSRAPPTRWTLIMLVVPETPTGTPAVMTTRSPCFTRPACSAAWMANSISWSVFWA